MRNIWLLFIFLCGCLVTSNEPVQPDTQPQEDNSSMTLGERQVTTDSTCADDTTNDIVEDFFTVPCDDHG